jgi:ATP-binding cassette subfamily B (MDR/TAP) protein 1
LIPNIQSFAEGSASAGFVFQIIDRKSKIDILDTSGDIPSKLIGDIEFKNVYFKYPARQDAQVNNLFFSLSNFFSLRRF